MASKSILYVIIQVRTKKALGKHTYAAVARTENTYLGTTTNGGMRVWKPIHIEYIPGALFAVTLKLINTIKALLNLPTGESIALIRPPTLPSA